MPTPFIQPAIIERLQQGTFVPQRRAKQDWADLQDRRNHLSPLAVTKRCIRYDPLVFDYRRDLVMRLIEDINHPSIKLVMIGGEQGTGKTSLVRGLVELMGGGREQLLWFDAGRYTDYEEIIQFLIQYIIYVASAEKQKAQPFSSAFSAEPGLSQGVQDPFKQLETLLKGMGEMPLLIVLDNMEYMVDSSLRLNSFPFKELLNFLLKFPNIKIIMMGERLPYADMAAVQGQAGERKIIDDIKLHGLSEQFTIQLLEKKSRETLSQEELIQIYRLTSGYPWLLKALLYLHQKSGIAFDELAAVLGQGDPDRQVEIITPIETVGRLIIDGLNDTQKKALQVMVFLRHTVDTKTLSALLVQCYPEQTLSGTLNALSDLDHSLLRPVLKINYPPQDVLSHLRQQSPHPFQPSFDLYVQFKKVIYRQISEFERVRLHEALADFYVQEKSKSEPERVSKVKPKALVAEANFHMQMAQRRRSVESVFPNPLFEEVKSSENLDSTGVMAQSYVASQENPLAGHQRSVYTLEDYKNITLPTVSGTLSESDANQALDMLLSEEEKSLLQIEDKRQDLHALTVDLTSDLPPQEDALEDSDSKDETLKAIQQRMTAAVASRNKTKLLRQLLALAEYRMSRGQHEQAEACLQKALLLEGSEFDQAKIWQFRGLLHKKTYHYQNATAYFKQALLILAAIKQPDSEVLNTTADILMALSEMAEFQKHPKQALEYVTDAIDYYQQAHSEIRLAEAWFKAAGLYDTLDQLPEALAAYQQSLRLNRTLSHYESCASALANMGHIYAETGEYRHAVECLHESFQYDGRVNNRDGQIKTLEMLALVYEDWHDDQRDQKDQQSDKADNHLNQAERYLKQALALLMPEDRQTLLGLADNPLILKANIYLRLGNLYARRQSWDNALKHYQWAKQTARRDLSENSLAYIDQKIQEAQKIGEP